MESRGEPAGRRSQTPSIIISRRACDPCRSRKIACDRGSPCANCVTARATCTHSAVSSTARSVPAKQRVLISAQYEQKIDDIARGISGINILLERLGSPATARLHDPGKDGTVDVKIDPESLHRSGREPLWDYSAHITEFIRDLATEGGKYASSDMSGVIAALADLAGAIDGGSSDVEAAAQVDSRDRSSSPRGGGGGGGGNAQQKIPMPPLEEAVSILRWAKEHQTCENISWLLRLLPLDRFTELCQKVYFAVDDYSDIDFILANGFLHYVFIERFFTTGARKYREYCCLCRFNLETSFRRLPLFLPAALDSIAALALGATNSIENGNAVVAWTFVSAAWDLCQRAKYNLGRWMAAEQEQGQNFTRRAAARESVIWSLYELDKGLALRLGRSPQVRDADVALPTSGGALLEPRSRRVARIQGRIHDELLSATGLLRRPDTQHERDAESMASDLRGIMAETRYELLEATSRPVEGLMDHLGILQLRTELVRQSSLLALVLRALLPPVPGSLGGGVSEECLAAARDTLKMHHACIDGMSMFEGLEYMMERYRNWTILHVPFASFSILLTHAIQNLDLGELAELDDFSASLGRGPALDSTPPPVTHPQRLYELLCKAARLYVRANTSPRQVGQPDMEDEGASFADALNEMEYSQLSGLAATYSLGDGGSDMQDHDEDGGWLFGQLD